ncbi:MAG: tRNA (adenosine(37)-N6)-threonylcarbamoyltransferase complex dimerization subunit type 1 TsaB, partial [Rubellimicrobium sp.]|nr:tRNA (adenosine(37)-N6)-threonylcarbamoyltransferase complex dimerization subunit type 1 TsaB [Rubellimicrobium sp.]
TSAAHCAAALLCEGHPPLVRIEAMATGQAERLIPLLDEVLTGAGLRWADLTALGVGTGPGNFTGIRIAVSAARGLALGLGIPAIGVDGLAALADGHPRPLTIRLPAPRGQVYVREFASGTEHSPRIEPGEGLSPDPGALVLGIARLAEAGLDQPRPRPAPLYLRAADAAPARDAPPPILP